MTLREFLISIGVAETTANEQFFGSMINKELKIFEYLDGVGYNFLLIQKVTVDNQGIYINVENKQ